MPSRGTDWNSVTEPLEQSMGMVAQHMLRAPQLRYRLDQERRKLDNDTMVSRAQAGNYDAQTAGHQEKTRGNKQKNDAAMRLLENKEAIDSVFGQTTPLTPEQNALRRQAITDLMIFKGTSATDSVTMLQRAAQGKMAAADVPTEQVARATGNITSLQVGAAHDATSVSNNAARIKAQGERGYNLPPGSRRYNADGTLQNENPSKESQSAAEYETTTQKFPEVKAVPSDVGWWSGKTNAPAVPYQPEKTVTTRKRIGDFNQITEPKSGAAASAEDKAALANQISESNPTWTRAQVLAEVKKRLSQ